MKLVHKILIGVGVFIVLIVGAAIYLAWNDLSPGDFFRSPTDTLDQTIFAAQEEDEELFRRGFTEETVEQMDELNDINQSRNPMEFDPTVHWTWETLMEKMAKEGGFAVEEEPSFLDRWSEEEARVTIDLDGRKKTYKFKKEKGVWRISLQDSDAGFRKARSCLRDEAYCR